MSNNQWQPNYNFHWNQPALPGDPYQLLQQPPPPPPPPSGHHRSPQPVPPPLPIPTPIPLNRAPTAVLGDPRLQPARQQEQGSQRSRDAQQVKKEHRRIEEAARNHGQKRSGESVRAAPVRIKSEPVDEDDEISIISYTQGQGYEAACKASEEAKLRKRARQIKEGEKKRRGDVEQWKQESLTNIARERAEAELEKEATEVAKIVREAETKKKMEELQKEIDKELVTQMQLELRRLQQSNAMKQEELERNAENAQTPTAHFLNADGTGPSSSGSTPSRRGRPRGARPVSSPSILSTTRARTRAQAAKEDKQKSSPQ